jgi:hypothetical protein
MSTGELPAVFQYSAPARRRALLLFVAMIMALTLLVLFLFRYWAWLGFPTRLLGVLLLLAAAASVREQLNRLRWRLEIRPDSVAITSPFRSWHFPSATIEEVQRIAMPSIGRTDRWICAILVPGRSGHPRRYYLFDSDVQEAARALDLLYRATPQARHSTGQKTK